MTFLGLDIGTSAVKAVLVDGEQQLLAEAEAPLTTSRPQRSQRKATLATGLSCPLNVRASWPIARSQIFIVLS